MQSYKSYLTLLPFDRIDLGDIDGFQPFTNGLLLDSWLIALLALIGLALLVITLVACVHYRNKKR